MGSRHSHEMKFGGAHITDSKHPKCPIGHALVRTGDKGAYFCPECHKYYFDVRYCNPVRRRHNPNIVPSLFGDERKVFEALMQDYTNTKEIAKHTHLPIYRIAKALEPLQAKGIISRAANNIGWVINYSNPTIEVKSGEFLNVSNDLIEYLKRIRDDKKAGHDAVGYWEGAAAADLIAKNTNPKSSQEKLNLAIEIWNHMLDLGYPIPKGVTPYTLAESHSMTELRKAHKDIFGKLRNPFLADLAAAGTLGGGFALGSAAGGFVVGAIKKLFKKNPRSKHDLGEEEFLAEKIFKHDNPPIGDPKWLDLVDRVFRTK